MKATMMQVPLNLCHFLERAGTLFGGVEIVSRMRASSASTCSLVMLLSAICGYHASPSTSQPAS